jgi:hypothetical protein
MFRKTTKWARNLVLFLLLVFGCPGSIAIVADITCHSSIGTWMPNYPNAETISVQHNFIRPRGLGSTVIILITPDDVETVENFYRQNIQTLVNKGTPRGMGSTDFYVEKNPEREGSRITLFSRCIV